ncbi:Protein CBD-1 [Aphelenchoides avenae]|nr:Protein CBD-1 [Aphelenchus avenae]
MSATTPALVAEPVTASVCSGDPNGAVSVGTCRSDYIQCENGLITKVYCARDNDVFSAKSRTCVPRAQSSELTIEEFCKEREDGFFRHPRNCSRIIQCFDKEVFEYPSCDYNLAFNELDGVCDYRDRVSGCSLEDGLSDNSQSRPALTDHRRKTSSCENHGDHVAHPSDCGRFFRCVWNRLVPMQCPSGTAFNPRLSVCDYPDQVDGCSSTASLASGLVTSPL